MYDEKDIYAVLGVEMPEAGDGQDDKGGADGAVTDGQQPAEGREVAEPGQQPEGSEHTGLDDGEDPAAGDEPDVDGQGGEPTPKKALTKEERARFAAQRRKAELDAAVKQALDRQKAQFDQQMANFFASAGMKDPITGKPVTSMEEYTEMQKAQQARQIQKNLREGKLLPEDLQVLIAEQMAEHRDMSGQNAAAPSAVTAEARTQPAQLVTQAQIDAELAEINSLDPGVKNLEDILALETGPAFAAAVKRGASFIDAFKLANFDRLQQRRQQETARRTQQAALNSQRSKEHLTVNPQTGGGSVTVPGETMAMYRMLMPNLSEDEIVAHYNKHYKSIK